MTQVDNCSGTKETFWECVKNEFNPIRASLSKVAEKMECCFYEEHKDLMTYSYYKDSGDGKEPSLGIAGLELTNFTFEDGDVYKGDEVGVAIYMDWGDNINAVPPAEDTGCTKPDGTLIYVNCTGGGMRNPFIVSHINVHACLLTATQTTCSIKFPQDTSVSSRNLQGPSYFGEQKETRTPKLTLDIPGDYKLMGHIRYYVEGDSVRTLWDIGMTKLVTVLNATTTTKNVYSGTGTLFSFTALLIFIGFM